MSDVKLAKAPAADLSAALSRFVANPYLFTRGDMLFVKFGPLTGLAFAIGCATLLTVALSAFGPGPEFKFFILNAYAYPPIILMCSVFREKLFDPGYWVRSVREIRAGTWSRPPAVLFAGLFPAASFTVVSAWALGVHPFLIGDLMAPVAMMGIGLARVACFNYGCCFGRECSHGFRPQVRYTHDYSWVNRARPHAFAAPRYPVQLIELAGGLALSIPLWAAAFTPTAGLATALFFVLYGLLRFSTEFVREAQVPRFLRLTLWQWIALACVALGFATLTLTGPRIEPFTLHAPDLAVALAAIVPAVIAGFVQFSFVFGLHQR